MQSRSRKLVNRKLFWRRKEKKTPPWVGSTRTGTWKIRKTDASVGGLVATSTDAASDAFASLFTAARDADLRLLAGHSSRADVRQTGASSKRISVVSFEAGASG
jgi:hypothetical protein